MAVVRVGAVKTSYSGLVIIFMLERGFIQFTLQYFPCSPVEYVIDDFGYVTCWLKMLLISLDVGYTAMSARCFSVPTLFLAD